jgi:threonine/homoserine/homoserine lactone efflux protein
MGAMSPGPSLALIMRHTLMGSRSHGVVAAVAHGLGIGVYAFGAVAGLAVIITRSPTLFGLLRYGGAAFLAYLGIRALLSKAAVGQSLTRETERLPRTVSARDGFLIAFLNPKIAVFLIALLSQFVRPEAGWGEKLGIAAMTAGIDTVWYVLVALALSHSAILDSLRQRAVLVDRVFGVVLLLLALRVVLLDA